MQDPIYNCPNCGAPIGYSQTCAYCGTRLTWIPQMTVYLDYKRADVDTLLISHTIDKFRLKQNPEFFTDAVKEIAREFGKELPKYIKIDKMFDIENFANRYRCELKLVKPIKQWWAPETLKELIQ